MVIDLSWLTKLFGNLPSDPAFITALTGTVMGVLGIGLFAYLIFIAFCILVIAATWKMFRAAGDKGWKSLIPVYNEYTMFKLTWSKKAFWVYFILSLSGVIILSIGAVILVIAAAKAAEGAPIVFNDFESLFKQSVDLIRTDRTPWIIGGIVILLGIGILCAVCVIKIISLYHISKAYNHGFGYFAGLFFFESTFRLIIGFDTGLTYVGNAAARKGIVEEPKKKEKKPAIPENPAYNAPAYNAPAYNAPSYNAPASNAPAYNAPAYNTPAPAAPEYNAYNAQAPTTPGYNAQAPVFPEYNAPAPAAETAAFAAAATTFEDTEKTVSIFAETPEAAVNTATATAEAAAQNVQTTAEAAAQNVQTTAEAAAQNVQATAEAAAQNVQATAETVANAAEAENVTTSGGF